MLDSVKRADVFLRKPAPVAPELQHEIEQFYYWEAKLLNDRRFEEWFALLAADIHYFMPIRTTRIMRDARVQGRCGRGAGREECMGQRAAGGVDVPLSNGWGLFLDIKKIYVKTTARGTVPAFGGPPAEASIRLNPLLVHAGISWRF